MTWSTEAVAAALQRVGLDPDAFDLEETAADLEARTVLNDSLASLTAGRSHVAPPIAFDPRW